MGRTARARLVDKQKLGVAHAENLAGDALGAIGGEINRKRGDLFRRHLLHALYPHLFLWSVHRNRIDHARPSKRRDAIRTDLEALHVERDPAREPDDTELGRHVIGLAEIPDQRRARGHVYENAAVLLTERNGAAAAHVAVAFEE